MNFLNENKKIILLILIILLEICIIVLLLVKKEENNEENIVEEISLVEDEQNTGVYKVDIKGAIKNPGVYELDSNSIINDVINMAGGLKSNANTSNINLSKNIENEMVIKIFTNNEIKKLSDVKVETCEVKTEIISDCKDSGVITINKESSNNNVKEPVKEVESTEEINKLININTATKEELMTLSGVGESKAISIVEYRNNTPFTKIEDIMNVSGIGEAAFAKIKEYITV